ncbi:hypothetical protein B1756_02075 [Natrarchaeobaculum aegyptiacum]|uniref:Blue (type 1) copper domain-containing protein n=1 Tax=Natrarchaeobaculum aegyptiacum TaxID=745377 RepID=A0A2Z2HWP0_9EURY|nr:hypothetical protein B1756_02075 [Natrarchaeobaculum aegyptiacum]
MIGLPIGAAGCLDDPDPGTGPNPESDSTDDLADDPAPSSDTADVDVDTEDGASVEDDGDDESDDGIDDEDELQEAAREVARALLEAVVDGDTETAVSYAPVRDAAGFHREEWTQQYEESFSPDEVHAIDYRSWGPEDALVGMLPDGDPGDGRGFALQYDLDLESDGVRFDHRLSVSVVYLEGEWYAWLYQPFQPTVDATVDLEREGLERVDLTLADRDGPATVFVTGDGIDDPSDYELESTGESITVTVDDVGTGGYAVVVVPVGEDPETGDTIEAFDFVDLADWADVSTIELEALTAGWEGISPSIVEGVENPTLVLEAGREYTIDVKNGDGAIHQLQLRDAADDPVDEYETPFLEGADATEELTVTATDELAAYVCAPHEMTMQGSILVVDSLAD